MIDARLAEMATAQPLTTDPAIVDTLSLVVQSYAAQLRPLLEAIDTFEAQIAAVFAAHPDQELFMSFPGAGAVCAPRLAAAFGTDRTRWDAATELQSYVGIAVILIFGAKRLSGLGRGMGQAIRGFKEEVEEKQVESKPE